MRYKSVPIVLFLLFNCIFLQAQTVHIWQGTPVKAKGVTLTPYLPDDTNDKRTAVIVCPGGSYFWLDEKREGHMVAEWLQKQGIAAFLLKYRTGGWFDFTFRSRPLFGGNQFPDMRDDLHRSIQLVRENAASYGVSPDRVGAMGFSAGGHLVLSSATCSDADCLGNKGIVTSVPLHPDFVAPIYPVVTMSDERIVHKRSRRGLLGESRVRDRSLRDSLSIEKNIHEGMPPVFLLNCIDDEVVNYLNSVVLDSALTANKIPHLYVQYKTGGHGFGADPDRFTEDTRFWQESFLEWIKKLFQETVFADEKRY